MLIERLQMHANQLKWSTHRHWRLKAKSHGETIAAIDKELNENYFAYASHTFQRSVLQSYRVLYFDWRTKATTTTTNNNRNSIILPMKEINYEHMNGGDDGIAEEEMRKLILTITHFHTHTRTQTVILYSFPLCSVLNARYRESLTSQLYTGLVRNVCVYWNVI